jgi:hypothetical protein
MADCDQSSNAGISAIVLDPIDGGEEIFAALDLVLGFTGS